MHLPYLLIQDTRLGLLTPTSNRSRSVSQPCAGAFLTPGCALDAALPPTSTLPLPLVANLLPRSMFPLSALPSWPIPSVDDITETRHPHMHQVMAAAGSPRAANEPLPDPAFVGAFSGEVCTRLIPFVMSLDNDGIFL